MNPKRTLVLLATLLLGGAKSPLAFGQEDLSLAQAIEDGKVEAKVTGIGGSTGDTILITIRRTVPETIRLTLTPGTVFRSVSGTVQNMACAAVKGERVGERSYRPTTEILLTDDGSHTYVIEAYCLNFHKANPGPSDRFTITSVDARAARLLIAGKDKAASMGAIQASLWMRVEGLSPAQVQARFPVTSQDIEVARSVIGEVAQAASQLPRREPEAARAGDTTSVVKPGDTVIVANEGAKLMAGNTAIAVLAKGTEVRVAEVSGRWIAVSAVVKGASTIGWVGINDLKPISTNAAPKPSSGSRALAGVNRADQFTKGEKAVITAAPAVEMKGRPPVPLPPGTAVVVVEMRGDWVGVAVRQGDRWIVGWIEAKYLAHATANGKPEVEAATVGKNSKIERTKPQEIAGSHTVLPNAAHDGDIEAVKALLSNGVSVETTNPIGQTALITAASEGHTEIVKLLLDKGANVNAKDNYGQTATRQAVPYTETLKVLLAKNVDASSKESALFLAANRGYVEAVGTLLETGANPNGRTERFETPLMWAVVLGHVDIVTLLLKKGANVNAETTDGTNALMAAAVKRDGVDIMRLLVENGAHLNATDEKGRTALMGAAVNGLTDAVKLLVEKGADLNVTDAKGYTALRYAEDRRHQEAATALRSKGAK